MAIINNYPQWAGWPGNRTAIIAEIGMNHGGDEKLAWDMIQAAHESGADFVKLQSYVTDRFFHPSLPYYSGIQAMELSQSVQERLFSKAADCGIALASTCYDNETCDIIDRFKPPFHKIASMDNDNIPLIRHVARKNKPILVSCGMATIGEIENVIKLVSGTGNRMLSILHCVSDYPAKSEDLNLSMLQYLSMMFAIPVGYSDHHLAFESSFLAISLGASVIEKHFTLDRSLASKMPDADHDISIQPEELTQMRAFSDSIPKMLGSSPRTLTPGETERRKSFRRGLYARRDLFEGDIINEETVSFLRPVNGISVGEWDEIKNLRLAKPVKSGGSIKFSDIAY